MKKFCLLALLCLYLKTAAGQVQRLDIGAVFPPMTFNNILNAPVFEIHSSSFSGKLVILDYWATWCGACITAFPKMQQLQEQFGSQLQIILVNGKSAVSGDTPEKIEKTLRRTRERTERPFTLPVVYNNLLLDSLFPYTTIPHEVWIKDGKVLAITSDLEVTEANIAAVLRGERVKFRLKKDLLAGEKPSLLKEMDNVLMQAVVAGYQEGYNGSGTYRDPAGGKKITGLYSYNRPIADLLREASSDNGLFPDPPNRTVLEVADPFPFLPHTDTAIYRYRCCYELRLPPVSFADARNHMFTDLTRAFNLVVCRQIRPVKCLVVRWSDQVTRLRARGGEPVLEMEAGTRHKFLKNYPVKEALALLDRLCTIPIIDETGSDMLIDLDLPDDPTDPLSLQTALSKAGFRVETAVQPMETTVIADR